MPRDNSNTQTTVEIKVSPGELLDRISILEIKQDRLNAPEQLENVRFELGLLRDVQTKALQTTSELRRLKQNLRTVNESLWKIEDEIRACEAAKNFGHRFIELARSVYLENDRRAAIKREINLLLGSTIIEEKSYSDYSTAHDT